MTSRRAALGFLALLLAGCRLDPVAVAGKACPCPVGLACDSRTETCVPFDSLDFAGTDDLPTLSADATLASLTSSVGTIDPPFSPTTTSYTLEIPLGVEDVRVTPTTSTTFATVLVANVPNVSGTPSVALDIRGLPAPITIVVTAPSGESTTYNLAIVRAERIIGVRSFLSVISFANALASDGDTLAVGAPADPYCATGVDGPTTDGSCGNSGAVFVYVRSGTQWTQQAYLKPAVRGTSAFGTSVALSGDTLVVGAPNDLSCATGVDGDPTPGGCSYGAAYVFVRNGSSWAQDAYLKPPIAVVGIALTMGASVAVAADTVAVGTTGDPSCATGIDGDETSTGCASCGAVHVFARASGAWVEAHYLKAASSYPSELFGAAVALSTTTLAVGTPQDSSCATGIGGSSGGSACNGSGAVTLFERNDVGWAQTAYVKASNSGGRIGFGASLALSGDTLLVGAPTESSCSTGVNGDQSNAACSQAGAAYVFDRIGGVWAQNAYLKGSIVGSKDYFGAAVALASDGLVVGANGDGQNAGGVDPTPGAPTLPIAGAAHGFALQAGAWVATDYLKSPMPMPSGHFGNAVAISPGTLFVSAPFEKDDGTPPAAGAVYAYPRE